jgi:hypothetical protein
MENASLAGTAAIYTAIAFFLAILLVVLARVMWFYLALLLLAISGPRERSQRKPTTPPRP